jgi:hypothetical protein
VKLLEPLTVQDIGLATRDVLYMSRIDQEDLKATGFKDLKQGDPVHPCGFHGHGLNATLRKPVSERIEICRKTLERSNRVRVPIRWNCHIVNL